MTGQENELEMQQEELHRIRNEIGLNRKEFAAAYGIPLRTIEDWEHGKRKMPTYLLRLLAYKVKLDALSKTVEEQNCAEIVQNVNVICDAEGKS